MIWIPNRVREVHPLSRNSRDQAIDVLKQMIKDSGLAPGIYRKRDEVDYRKLIRVHRDLCEFIEEEVSRFDVLDLCRVLSLRHEYFIRRDPMRTGPVAITIQTLRSLIELAVKSCELSGVQADKSDSDYIFALAHAIINWDLAWDQFSMEPPSQEIVIREDYSFDSQPINWTDKAMQRYSQYISDMNRINEIHRDNLLVLPYEDSEPESILLWLKSVGLLDLSECLETEIGYSLVDYFRFMYGICSWAVIDGFDFAGCDHEQAILECRRILGIPELNSRALIEDFSLSAHTLSEVPTTEIFSVGRRNRDTRFMRRPIMMIGPPRQSILMFGPDTLAEATDIFRIRLLTGHIPVARWSDNKNIRRVFGEFQSMRGDHLRDAVARDCEKIVGKDKVIVEKDYISGVKSDPDLGPIDVFVVDEVNNRFVLVEAKNSMTGNVTPQLLRDERREFLEEFLPTLEKKAAWFRSHMMELKREFRISTEKEFTVECVIVLHRHQFWIMADRNRLPIIDTEEFLAKLAAGQELLSDPVDPSN